MVGPIGARRICFIFAGVAILTSLILDLADAARPEQRLGLLLGAIVIMGLGWYIGRLPDERESDRPRGGE